MYKESLYNFPNKLKENNVLSFELFTDSCLDAILDTLKILPFLFLAYLLIEILEHHAEDKTTEIIHRAGSWGPVLGSALGIIPQCGFSAATANLFAGGLITRGTLIAVFLSTSDEMLPILISKSAPAQLILKILLYKFAAGMIAGFVIDLIEKRVHKADTNKELHDICEQEGCNCEDGVLRSAGFHTVKIAAFLLVTSFLINMAVGLVGEEHLADFILNKAVIGELLAGLVGLIPNCAASVILTELYLQGGMSAGAMLSGLLCGAGVGLLVLFRMNKRFPKDNLITLLLLYTSGVLLGLLATALPIF